MQLLVLLGSFALLLAGALLLATLAMLLIALSVR
jgi:hypothetical protein